MQGEYTQKINKTLNFKELSVDEKHRLIDVFAWLIKEDKKQNPALYKTKIKLKI